MLSTYEATATNFRHFTHCVDWPKSACFGVLVAPDFPSPTQKLRCLVKMWRKEPRHIIECFHGRLHKISKAKQPPKPYRSTRRGAVVADPILLLQLLIITPAQSRKTVNQQPCIHHIFYMLNDRNRIVEWWITPTCYQFKLNHHSIPMVKRITLI